MDRHSAMENAARGMVHHDKHGEPAQGGGDHHAEGTRDDGLGLLADKGVPVWRGRACASMLVHALWHGLAHRAWRYLEAQRQQECIGHTRLAPCGVLVSHTTNQRLGSYG